MRTFKCQRGYTMIETIGVLAIIAVVAGSAVAFLDKAFFRYKMARLSQQVVEIQKSIDRRFAAKKTYENLTLALLKNEGLLPSDMVFNNNKLYHRLKGEVTLTLGNNSENYTIIFKDLPRYACAELIEQNWGLDPRVVLDSINVGNVKLKWKCAASEQNCYRMPLNASVATQVCSGASNNVSWTFY